MDYQNPTGMAEEFTPELSQSYLASLLNPIDEREQSDVAEARREGQLGGLVAQAATGSRVGAIESQDAQLRNQTINRFNWDVAGKQYGERMTDEARAFQDTERRKAEDFKTEMASLGYQFDVGSLSARQGFEKDQARQGLVIGSLLSLGSQAAGKYAGSKMGGGGSSDNTGDLMGNTGGDTGVGASPAYGGPSSDYNIGDTAALGF